MEQKLKQLLMELYYQVVEDVPPEVGSRHLWDTLDEVAQVLNLGQSETPTENPTENVENS